MRRGWHGRTDIERFESKIRRSDGCWIWTGSTRKGYGVIRFAGRQTNAHRVAYETWIGPIPVGYQIDHLCRNHGCVNPDHLEAVTPRENTRRGLSPNAISHESGLCRRGHVLVDHARYRKTGPRAGHVLYCRACRTESRVAA